MDLLALAEFIESQTDLTAGTDLFQGILPDEANSGIYLKQSPSEEPSKYVGTQYQNVDVFAVYPDSKSALAKLRDVYLVLHRRHHYEIDSSDADRDNYYIHASNALGENDILVS